MSTETDEVRTGEDVEYSDGRHRDDEPPAPDQLVSLDLDPAQPDSGPQLVIVRADGGKQPLLTVQVQSELLGQWTEIQLSFVDDPRGAVQDSEVLIAEIAATIQRAFQERSRALAAGWNVASDTEELRLALWHYRSFVDVVLPR